MLTYSAVLTPDDNGTVMVTFPDVPEAASFGDDEANALANGAAALETALAAYVTDRRPIPEPSSTAGLHFVTPGLLGSLKLAVYAAMLGRGWNISSRAMRIAAFPNRRPNAGPGRR